MMYSAKYVKTQIKKLEECKKAVLKAEEEGKMYSGIDEMVLLDRYDFKAVRKMIQDINQSIRHYNCLIEKHNMNYCIKALDNMSQSEALVLYDQLDQERDYFNFNKNLDAKEVKSYTKKLLEKIELVSKELDKADLVEDIEISE